MSLHRAHQRMGAHPRPRHPVGAVAVGGRRTRRNRLERSAALSTSVASRSPVAVGVPGTTPASSTAPVAVPVMIAASLVPVMVIVTSCAVPSSDRTVNVSLSGGLNSLSALTVALVLSSV